MEPPALPPTTDTTGRVLLVEDDPDDRELMRLAFSRLEPGVALDTAAGGAEALAILDLATTLPADTDADADPTQSPMNHASPTDPANPGDAPAAPGSGCPDLMLLDLKMPGMDGQAVLAEVRSRPALRHLPTIILSTSSAPADVAACYQLGCNAYVVKPYRSDELRALLKDLAAFWLRWVRLPDHH